MKTIATLTLSAALLAGCALPAPPARPEPYDLGPLPAAAHEAAAQPGAPLLWGGVSAPRALDGTAIIYRLLYVQDGQQPRPYARASWAEAPAQLMGQRLRAALTAARPVADTDAGLTAPELRIELDDFSQAFDSPELSYGVVRLRATLLTPGGPDGAARQIEQRSFAARIPAPSNDAAGGAQALKTAADQVIGEVAAWVGGR